MPAYIAGTTPAPVTSSVLLPFRLYINKMPEATPLKAMSALYIPAIALYRVYRKDLDIGIQQYVI
ncbi:hypothetical protein GCM10023188_00510 [Pontibacter saemangeumensis]|uniref:Uncharacterized protein n=1 Tax=Pontibacter saemangeumensis TaxID=1084525 RepID=A0ABP8L6I7_9BACT